MKNRRSLLCALTLLPLLLTGRVMAKGKDKEDHDVAYEAMRRGEILPLSRILAIVAERVPGEIIKVELEGKRLQYKLKVLAPDGRVRKMRLDARSGATLSIDVDE
ncbi:PepSY domain-containing protein [Polaromonas jejuensis]|uniref:PepSY domain-containing protein n=1 Tax=Polaromonas jejuensis TaxID=457502 RepID=A0ABW0Q720_9BURK|nr:PepSY domain-containing protein [Polaromonas jejuensis]